jgi:hypothetical protein
MPSARVRPGQGEKGFNANQLSQKNKKGKSQVKLFLESPVISSRTATNEAR